MQVKLLDDERRRIIDALYIVKEAQEVGNALSVAKRHEINAKTLYHAIQNMGVDIMD